MIRVQRRVAAKTWPQIIISKDTRAVQVQKNQALSMLQIFHLWAWQAADQSCRKQNILPLLRAQGRFWHILLMSESADEQHGKTLGTPKAEPS